MLCWYMRISHQCVSRFFSVIDFVKRYRFSTQICQDEWILYVFAYSFLSFSISKCVVTLYLWTFQFSTLARGLCVALSCWTISRACRTPSARCQGGISQVTYCRPMPSRRLCSVVLVNRCWSVQLYARQRFAHVCAPIHCVCARTCGCVRKTSLLWKRAILLYPYFGRFLLIITSVPVSCFLSSSKKKKNSCCHAVEI